MPIRDDDVEELVAWLRSTWLAGSGDRTSAGMAAAEEFARRHAGELVGMRWDEDAGKWKQAKRQEYRIGKDIRDGIREAVREGTARGDSVGTIRDSLEQYVGQIEGRALEVARTESAIALSTGQLAAGTQDGVEHWLVSDGPGCLLEGHDDEAPLPDDVVGAQLDRQADGQILTTEEAAQYVIGHPNCARFFSPLLPEQVPGYREGGE